MSDITIEESDMVFGPFAEEDLFQVETCEAYKRIVGSGVKVAEFAWRHPARDPAELWVVEAKSSTPRPTPQERFVEFIGEIRDKLLNAWSMVVAAHLGRPGAATDELPANVASLDFSSVQPRFILVIRGHRTEWLPPLQDALARAMNATAGTWGISAPAVTVMNDDIARKRNLIQ